MALLVANFAKPVVRQVSSEFEIGTLFMYLFFVAIGAGANIAEVLGAAPAAALAAGKGWHALVAPGVLVGMFGYAIATFIGVAIAALLG